MHAGPSPAAGRDRSPSSKIGARTLFRRALVSGTLASVASTVAISLASRRATGAPAAGTNATSHWLWGERAKRRFGFSLRYTGVGYAVHHAASVFWALVFERWQARREPKPVPSAARAAGIAALAFVVDYTVTPHRLRPGFERHLRPLGMLATYAAFAAGLAAATLLRRRSR